MERVEVLPSFPRLIEAGGVFISFLPRSSDVMALDAVHGFDALTTGAGNLYVSTPRVDGFSSLVAVGGYLQLTGLVNRGLERVEGFGSLGAVTDSLRIWNTAEDFVLPAFASLASTGGLSLCLPPHDDAFPALVTVAGSVELDYHASAAPPSSALRGFPILATITGDTSLRTTGHAEIDVAAFPVRHEVGGSIAISLSPSGERIGGFGALTRASSLEIRANTALTTADGFGALRELHGTLALRDNEALVSIGVFANLERLSGSLEVERNASLATLEAFHALRTAGRIEVADLPLLTSWQGFDQLRSANAIYVLRNPLLWALPSFPALTTLSADLRVGGNTFLARLEGFEALERAQSIQVGQNRPLRFAASGFGALQSLCGELRFEANDFNRISIDGFYAVTTVSGGLAFDPDWVSVV